MKMKRIRPYWGLTLLLFAAAAGPVAAQKQNSPSSLLRVVSPSIDTPGDGYLTGGDLWDTVKPPNTSEPGLLGSNFSGQQMNNRMMFGSRGNWQEPSGQWPSGYHYTNKFRNSHIFTFPVFKADGWPNYAKGGGNPVRELDGSADDGGANGSSRFMFALYGPNVPGANDPSRNYKRPAYFTDESRTHMVYEAGWPTTAGIDFKLRAHQYSSNEQNLNDFIVIEMTMTNTGVVDTNGDGTPEATDNVIDGVAVDLSATISPSIQISISGDRGCNCINAGRTFGYVAAPDASGAPMDMFVYYANVPATNTANRATPALHDFGIIGYNLLEGYADIWNGWNWMGVRQGAISDGPLGGPTANSPDKPTVFGTHSVGEGERRGWYTSSEWKGGSVTDSEKAFRHATAVWYEDYGKVTDPAQNQFNLNPNPAFFSGGTPGDISTFVVGNPDARPNGDFKYASEDISKAVGIEQPVWEPAWNPGAANNSFYDGAIGYTKEYTFSQNPSSSIGPYRLEVGESMTVVWVTFAGYRLAGIYDALEAARWAWERGWDISADMPTPPAPDVSIESNTDGRSIVRWTDVRTIDPNIDGYKIWRAAQYKRTSYLEKGMRLVDNYHHQHEVGASTDGLLEPINPNFNAQNVFQGDIQGTYQPAEWGTYDLVAKIPLGDLNQYEDAHNGYAYAWEDAESITGFTYWYYVSAYTEGSFQGPHGPVSVGHIESSNLNRNGRNAPNAAPGTIGLETSWGGTYPFALVSAAFPRSGTLAYDNLGAPFTVTPAVARPDQVASLITVTPNPYKITGLNDVRNRADSHNIDFLNLPEAYTLTIIDVSGQIVFQTNVEGATDGKFTWDMFSKDGVEVSSGLYIYHVQYDGGAVQGHFAILR